MSNWREQFDDELDQFLGRVRGNKNYQDLERRYLTLNDRERQYVNVATVAFVLWLLYQIVLSPALTYLSRASNDYQKQLENYEWMQAQEAQARTLIEAGKSTREGSLLSIASATAKNHELAFSRFDPDGDARVRLWLEQVKFNDLVSWLGELEAQHGVSAVDISLDSSTPGYVSVRLTLQG
jgi:general secretion pathway protein M